MTRVLALVFFCLPCIGCDHSTQRKHSQNAENSYPGQPPIIRLEATPSDETLRHHFVRLLDSRLISGSRTFSGPLPLCAVLATPIGFDTSALTLRTRLHPEGDDTSKNVLELVHFAPDVSDAQASDWAGTDSNRTARAFPIVATGFLKSGPFGGPPWGVQWHWQPKQFGPCDLLSLASLDDRSIVDNNPSDWMLADQKIGYYISNTQLSIQVRTSGNDKPNADEMKAVTWWRLGSWLGVSKGVDAFRVLLLRQGDSFFLGDGVVEARSISRGSVTLEYRYISEYLEPEQR